MGEGCRCEFLLVVFIVVGMGMKIVLYRRRSIEEFGLEIEI